MIDPLVSIVTPSLNQGAFIGDALLSVRSQSYSNVQHIVIDGGSTDGTLNTLRDTSGVRWIAEPDRGMYDAIRKGLRMADGEILGYLNCDDVYTPWAIETAVRAFDANPSAAVVYGDGLTIDTGRNQQRLSLIPALHPRWLAFSGSLVQPAVFWRRRASDLLGGFDADLQFVGDLDFWLRISRQFPAIRVDEVLAIERVHEASLSQASAARMAIEDVAMRRRHHGATGRRAALGVVLARARAAVLRRRLLLAFLRATRGGGGATSRWGRFLTEGDVRISPSRLVLSLVPRLGGPFAWGSVASRRRWFGDPSTKADERR
jgi:glycosyltransferase involved in cell wall biosynthesis